MSANPNSTARRTRFAVGTMVALTIATGYLILFREPVSATQPPPTTYTLTINRTGGGGTVEVEPPTPPEIVSSFSWTHSYQLGTSVEVQEHCVSPWSFKEWTGDFTQHGPHTIVEMDANKTVTAVFVQADVSIDDADICGDEITVTTSGAVKSGTLLLELIAQSSRHTIYSALKAAGTYTVSFG